MAGTKELESFVPSCLRGRILILITGRFVKFGDFWEPDTDERII